jgi:hypothetical protein
MTVRLNFRAEVKNNKGKKVLVIRANALYDAFLKRVRSEAQSKGITEGKFTVTAKEWDSNESYTFDL